MTSNEIIKDLHEIQVFADKLNNKDAHRKEAALYFKVLEAISRDEYINPPAIAKLALEASRIEFDRI